MTAAAMGEAAAPAGEGAGEGRAPSLRRWIETIWHIEGAVPLAPGQTPDDAFDRLMPLFRHTGTTVQQQGDTLTFHKTDPAAQDPLAVFDRGVLEARTTDAAPVLHYRLVSRILLLCFLAPLLFLAFAQATVLVGKLEAPSAEAAKKKAEKKQIQLPQNAIDKALGAPAPDAPKKDKKPDDDKKPKPTAAYVFAGIFAFLYVAGRFLEAWRVRKAFAKRLAGDLSGD
ncbi:hypothetical protein [Sphingomonas adhaesiva]|uniref:hypothetical protein n=1 Tax=Sphingomonas adhaesiva TaxID=28212 RepID=UPI002FF8A393